MITIDNTKEVRQGTGWAIHYEITCLDTDTKPIYNDMANGSALLEISTTGDDCELFVYDKTNNLWRVF